MDRILAQTTLNPSVSDEIKKTDTEQTWYLITEAWCCDSAHSLPVIAKIASDANSKVDLKIVLRDDNPEFTNLHQTNNKSIPKLVCFDKEGNKLFEWGSRPAPAQQLFLDWKAHPEDKTWEDFKLGLFRWYDKDNGATLQQEFLELLKTLAATEESCQAK